MRSPEPVNLTNCDREPIHIPGSIQSHGWMLACDMSVSHVLCHSANAGAMLRHEGQINGLPLHEVVGPEATHALRNALATSNDAARPALLFGLRLPSGVTVDAAVHRHKSTAILEFEPADPADSPVTLARNLIGRVKAITDTEQLMRMTVRLIQGLLEYDRVMIYRFAHDGAGQVVSEARRDDLEGFLGQYFPATDIPQQARELYLRNTIRAIADAHSEPVAVVPRLDASGEPLDLSFAQLRSVSPIHCEYLRNMGVSASMSISIIVGGALWGLIACHHYSPRRLSIGQRVAAEMFGEFFSLHLEALTQKRKLDNAVLARQSLDRFLQRASHQAGIGELLRANLAEIGTLVASDGVGMLLNDEWTAAGTTPPPEAVPELSRFVATVSDGRVWATHALSRQLPAAEDYAALASGMLVVPLSHRPKDYLFFFRREVVQTLNWAGNPEKTYDTGPLGDRLTPRKSFAIWKETVQRQAQPWSEEDRDIAEATRGALVEIVLRHYELLAEERSKADLRQRMMNEELNHRVKNILAIIKSLVGHPVEEGRSIVDYVASLKGRIGALALAHDQIVRGDGGGLLLDLLDAEIGPYRSTSTTIALDGPPLWLDAPAFSVMVLVLHEMATNAAKYGALTVRGGRLDVAWRVAANGDCVLTWRESGGPKVTPPARRGFGSLLVDRSVPHDLGGESSVDFAVGGVQARFLIPGRHVADAEARQTIDRHRRGAAPGSGAQASAVASARLLLVEDQMIIAMDVEAMLAAKGIAQVTTCASADDALRLLQRFTPDAAILDVNLGTGTSVPVAEELQRRNIPFVFATGYGDRSMIPPQFQSIPVARKPFDADTLVGAIAAVLPKQQD